MRRVLFGLGLLVILLLGVLVAGSAVPPATANPTYCWCEYMGGGWWCYRCCDATGCEDLYCDWECP